MKMDRWMKLWGEFPRCKVISIDIMDEDDALATLTAVERERVSYHNFDVSNLTYQELEGILWRSYGIGVKDLTHLHWSPMCSTMSSADLGSNGYTGRIGSRRHLAENPWLVSLGCSGGAQRSCRVHPHIIQHWFYGKPIL